MKKFTHFNHNLNNLIVFLLFPFLLFSSYPCVAQQDFDYLQVNNVRAYINPLNLFQREGSVHYEVPKDSGKVSIYNSNIWLAGLDVQDNLHVAAHLYNKQGDDFFLGPITDDYTIIDGKKVVSTSYIQKYHHTWKVSKAEIDFHREHYNNPSYVMPFSIANWPAHGRTQYGESTRLAPYKKVSGNGFYTPSDGDYPEIRGDEAVFFILNDALNPHTETGGASLGVEILGMAYAFNSPEIALQNTTFLHYTIKNKSANNYKDFYFGYFADFDIGFKLDDYIGCDSTLNLAFAYNGLEIDGTGQTWSYGLNPPSQGAMFLNQTKNAFMSIKEPFPPLPSPTDPPEIDSDFYNYMRARWKDGTPLTRWGNGYNPDSTNYTKYMYNHAWDTTHYMMRWWEYEPTGPSSMSNDPGDRLGVMSAGPFTLLKGESISIDIALPFAKASSGGSLTSLALLYQYAQTIQDFYNTISGSVVYQNNTPFISGDVLLYSVKEGEQYSLNNQVRLASDGSYVFGMVPDGNYIIKVNPDNTEDVLPTYYGNTENWGEATIVTIANRIPVINLEITMIDMDPLKGSSIISGYVSGTSGGKVSFSKSEVSNPVPNVSVYLQTYQGNKWTTLAHALTNQEGYFVFKNVPIGSYRITLDVPGIEITDPPIVEITEDGQIVDDILFEIILGVEDVVKRLENKIIVYPNPTSGEFTIVSELTVEKVELYDIMGSKVFTSTPKTQTVQINTNLPQGMYIYRVVLQNGSTGNGKIVVQ